MENAIKKAIEGGYRNFSDIKSNNIEYHDGFLLVEFEGECEEVHYAGILLDINFWQALTSEKQNHVLSINPTKVMRVWHAFIDHIADGGSIDDFFNNLLK